MKKSFYTKLFVVGLGSLICTGCEKTIFSGHDARRISTDNLDKDKFFVESHSTIDIGKKVDKEYCGIVASVNEDIITMTDLNDRVNLALFSIGGSLSETEKQNLYKDILNEMVEEKLKKQCAKKYAQKGGWVSDTEVDEAFEKVAKRNNMTSKDFSTLLKSRNLKKEALLDQISVNLSWIEYIRARFSRNVVVSRSELKRLVADVKKRADEESFYICRMFFPFSESNDESKMLAYVNNLHQMLLHGASFANLARQFSKSADANKGGELGWIFAGQLSDEEFSTLKNMTIGSYKIVKNSRGYVILYLKDKKEAGLRNYTDINFLQVAMPLGDNSHSAENIKQMKDYICDMKKSSKTCQEFANKARESGIMGVSEKTSGIVEAMQPQFRNLISKIPAGGVSEPMVMDDAILVICVFDKSSHVITLPTEDELKNQRMDEQLSSLARAELNFLKRKSFIRIDKKYSSSSEI